MKRAVIYGGGNIGRGFIGAVLSQSGYEVTFIDVAENVVTRLHENGRYPVRIVENHGYLDIEISHVDAIHGNDTEAISEAIAQADVMATAVGAKILPYIAPKIAAGLRKRFSRTDAPLDILICENLMDANKALEDLLKAHLSPEEQALMDARVGLVETSIGRMVPVQTPEMQSGDPLRVCVEAYAFLPVDRDAFKGEIPAIHGLVPFSPFDFYIKRKLYLHNMGHACCAYLGGYVGLAYIYQAIDDAEILSIVQSAMLESAMALSSRYAVSLNELVLHMSDLLSRFRNAALMDTCERVGGDPTRKLQKDDRLIGSALLALEEGITPAYIAVGAAGAVYRHLAEAGAAQSAEAAIRTLVAISGLSETHPLTDMIRDMYQRYLEGEPISELRHAAERRKRESLQGIV